jgi:hypothetical protein
MRELKKSEGSVKIISHKFAAFGIEKGILLYMNMSVIVLARLLARAACVAELPT